MAQKPGIKEESQVMYITDFFLKKDGNVAPEADVKDEKKREKLIWTAVLFGKQFIIEITKFMLQNETYRNELKKIIAGFKEEKKDEFKKKGKELEQEIKAVEKIADKTKNEPQLLNITHFQFNSKNDNLILTSDERDKKKKKKSINLPAGNGRQFLLETIGNILNNDTYRNVLEDWINKIEKEKKK